MGFPMSTMWCPPTTGSIQLNEHIFKLASKAMNFHGAVDIDTELKLTNIELEKFAELIVRECVSKCVFVADMATITNTGEMARKTKATADSCATMIKDHFGVK